MKKKFKIYEDLLVNVSKIKKYKNSFEIYSNIQGIYIE